MTDFWKSSEDEDLSQSGASGEFDGGGGNIEPIPDGSKVLAMATEAKWQEYEGTEYISIQWQIAKPKEYENRRVFQKLYVTDADARAKDPAKKRDKALRMLAAIDKNAGGKLAKKGGRPSDVDLMGSLCGKGMLLKLGVWDMNGKTGNHVNAVQPKDGGEVEITEAKAKPASSSSSGNGASRGGGFADDLDDDVPF
jgi:hypothetical protein